MKKSSPKILHVIAFDVPFPPNYGGVVDIFFKLKALHSLGVEIILHAYKYGREEQAELKKYCKKVFYYNRKTFRNPFYGKLPYITASRNSTALLENLLDIDAPILFEGMHCCYYLDHEALKSRKKIVRAHNVEHDYYHHLELLERNIFKRYFFRTESEKLKEFESVLNHADHIAAISPADTGYYKKKFGKKTLYLPAFHPNSSVELRAGKGDFCFYHGNLAVGENEQAAMFLAEQVFSQMPEIPLVIAGSNPSRLLLKVLSQFRNIELRHNLSTSEVLEHISDAQINILYTAQSTGIKLKLINCLFRGRHCIANNEMVANTGMEGLCQIANTPEEYIEAIQALWNRPFEAEKASRREQVLMKDFDNLRNAGRIADLL